ncbi:ABC transporter ATP-binding protein [Limnohabitans sp.]|uniref:ABC transporter ATP-binding protein n=1 Tax=Limnohabitans sp. TaxID=1907725 RepID=UPI003919A6D2
MSMHGGLQVQLEAGGPIRLAASFDCAPGELVALVGPSGSGKTSMLRAIAGLWSPPALRGRIGFDQQVWFDRAQASCRPPQQRRVGLVFQHDALFPHMDVMTQVALAAGPGWDADGLGQLLERVGLGGLLHRRPAQLSGGQQQRVALARALVRVMPAPAQPAGAAEGVLLLDEPFSAVDAPTRQSLYRELAAWRQQVAGPMVLVTHDLGEARRLADRVVIVDAGQTLQAGPPDKVFASPRNARVAELVGIQNHYRGRFHKDRPGWARLQWLGAQGSVALEVIDKNRIDEGTPVTWVLNGEGVDVLSDPAAGAENASPEGPNLLPCRLQEVLPLGDISLCTLVPESLPDQRITLNLTGRLLRRLQAGPGGRVQLRLSPQALHIMPRK